VITVEEYLQFVDKAFDDMAAVLTELGDEAANRRPPGPGASPYALVTHCLGVVEFWAGHLIAGRDVERDRDAEFVAAGEVAALVARVGAAKEQLRRDLADARFDAPLRHRPPAAYTSGVRTSTQGAAAVHIFEELAQHLGHLELTRDVLVAR
jgi:hypothetical protein